MKNPILNLKKDIPKSDTVSAVPKVSQVIATIVPDVPIEKPFNGSTMTVIRIAAENEALNSQNFDIAVNVFDQEGELILALGAIDNCRASWNKGFAFYILPEMLNPNIHKATVMVNYPTPKLFHDVQFIFNTDLIDLIP